MKRLASKGADVQAADKFKAQFLKIYLKEKRSEEKILKTANLIFSNVSLSFCERLKNKFFFLKQILATKMTMFRAAKSIYMKKLNHILQNVEKIHYTNSNSLSFRSFLTKQ